MLLIREKLRRISSENLTLFCFESDSTVDRLKALFMLSLLCSCSSSWSHAAGSDRETWGIRRVAKQVSCQECNYIIRVTNAIYVTLSRFIAYMRPFLDCFRKLSCYCLFCRIHWLTESLNTASKVGTITITYNAKFEQCVLGHVVRTKPVGSRQ